MLPTVVLLYVASISTYVKGDAPIVAQTFKLPLKNCLYVVGDLKSAPQPSVAACALQCTRTKDCLCFGIMGHECGLLMTHPEDCIEATGSYPGWDFYCPEGKP